MKYVIISASGYLEEIIISDLRYNFSWTDDKDEAIRIDSEDKALLFCIFIRIYFNKIVEIGRL